MNVFLQKRTTETVDEFLKRLKPTETTVFQGSWIALDDETGKRDCESDSMLLYEDAQQAARTILSQLESDLKAKDEKRIKTTKIKLREEATTQLLKTACTFGQTTGKWLFFYPRDAINEIWAKIARETAAGNLGMSAKVATSAPGEDLFLICVYVPKFYDLKDVRRVFNRLTEIGLNSRSFKMDFFTVLGIDSKNQWGLTPSIYTATTIMKSETDAKMRAICAGLVAD